MNSIHRSGSSTDYYKAFTPQKSLSTRLSHINQSVQNKEQMSSDNQIIIQNELLGVQSMILFRQQQIKKSQVSVLLETIRLIRFLDKETKSLSKIIKLKKKNIISLNYKREDQIQNIQKIKKKAQIQNQFLIQKSKQIKLRNKQKEVDINYEIKLMKQKIRVVKSLSREQRRSICSVQNCNDSFSQFRSKNRHKRMHTQMGYKRQTKEKFNKVFIPIYVPYPVFAPYNPRVQSYQPNHINNQYFLQKEYYKIKENSFKNSQKNSDIYINQEEIQQQKIKQFCSKLREPLATKQSKKYSRKQSRKQQNIQSLRNSCKTSSSKGQIKPKLTKGPFETDQQVNNPNDIAGQSLLNQKNLKSKMGFKITNRNTCEDQSQKYSNKPNKVKDMIKTQIIQQLQSSTINVEILSDKKQNSPWEKDTIEGLNMKSIKINTSQLKPKMKVNDKQLSYIQQVQQHAIKSSLNGSDINIIITKSPSKSYVTLNLKNEFSSNQDQSIGNIEKNKLIKGKQSSKMIGQFERVGIMKQIVWKEEKDNLALEQSKEQVISQIDINDISDDDMLFSTALLLESKITRKSQNNQPKVQQVKQQDDQILNSISLTPESRISRLSREKQALKISRSELKQANTFNNINQKTSISDIRFSQNYNTIQNPLSSSQQNQLQLNQNQAVLRSTTPSKIIKKGKRPKKESNIDLMSGSIEQATEEEQTNLMSEIQFKNNRRKIKMAM